MRAPAYNRKHTLKTSEHTTALYQNFIGIDIGKFTFFVSQYGEKKIYEFENNAEGINKFFSKFKHILKKAFVVLQTTGGYEMDLLMLLCEHNVAVHRAHTRHVKNFIRSLGNGAKTDALDAKALCLYGFERFARLDLYPPPSPKSSSLYRLTQRRIDLKKMAVAEKNRLKAPNNLTFVQESCVHVLETVSAEIKDIIDADEILAARLKMLKTIPGVGDITAQDMYGSCAQIGELVTQADCQLSWACASCERQRQTPRLPPHRTRQKWGKTSPFHAGSGGRSVSFLAGCLL